MRALLVLLHRWFGLFMAVFLFVAGLTGALIAWDHELDALLGPEFYRAKTSLPPLPALELAQRLEAADPRVRVSYVPLGLEPGHTLSVFVEPRVDPATGEPFVLDFDQVALDPGTGEVQATRKWGAFAFSRGAIMPFLYKLHYTLHVPDGFGVELGRLFLGVVAIVWTLDAFIALWISFPNRKTWWKSFVFRVRAGGYRLVFDSHRSSGVWAWLLLLPLAFTAISMNLGDEIVRPVVGAFSPVTPNPFDTRVANPPEKTGAPALDRTEIVRLARIEAERRGWRAPPGGLFHSEFTALYGVGFFEPGNDHGEGLGNPWLYLDAHSGSIVGAEVPGEGTAGDRFMQLQFPLHSGRLLGIAGRVLVSLLGVFVAVLSVTGVVIWARKRRVRRDRASQGATTGEVELALAPSGHRARGATTL